MNVSEIVEHLRANLRTNNVDDSKYSDHQLELLFRDVLSDLEGVVGFKATPTVFTDVEYSFNSNTYLLSHYPVNSIKEVKIDGELVDKSNYRFNSQNGILRFNNSQNGLLEIDYDHGLSSAEVEDEIYPLVYDMIAQQTLQGNTNNIKSVKEGDFNITYSDNPQGLSKRVDERIQRLKRKRMERVELI